MMFRCLHLYFFIPSLTSAVDGEIFCLWWSCWLVIFLVSSPQFLSFAWLCYFVRVSVSAAAPAGSPIINISIKRD